MGRLVIQADIDAYNAAIVADGRIPMQLNDVIYPWADRNTANDNIYDKTAYVGARLGASVWIEAGPTPYNCIDIGTDTPGQLTVPTDANNPCHVFFFNGQGQAVRESDGLGGRDVQFYNFDHLIIDQETNTYPGMRDGWGSGRTGTFGLSIRHNFLNKGGMGIKVDHTGGTMKQLIIRGVELSVGSFAKIRTILSENQLDELLIERCLITRSVGGEGLYMGQTSRLSGQGWNRIVYTIRNNIFAFTAAEGLQLQQMASGSRVYNNVVFIAAHDFKSAFQPFQDTGWQLHHVQGGTRTYNNILYGHGSTGAQVFGVDASAQANPIDFGDERIRIDNNLFGGAKKGNSFRTNEGLDMGSGVTFRDNDIVDVQDNYQEVGSLNNYHADVGGSAAVRVIGGSAPDDGKPFMQDAPAGLKAVMNISRTNTVPSPEFVNSGFDGINVHEITKWSELYEVGHYWAYTENNPEYAENAVDPSLLTDGGTVTMITAQNASSLSLAPGHNVKVNYRPGGKSFYATIQSYSGNTITLNNISHRVGSGAADPGEIWDFFRERTHTAGEFVWLAEDQEVMPMHLYKCLVTHVAVTGDPEARRPDNDPTRWELVWWDVNGKNMYDPLYNGVPYTNDFMEVAGDFRLVKGSYHHLKGRGLLCNEQRDDQTMMGWQWKDEFDTIRDIPGAYSDKLRISDYSYLRSGRSYRFWVEKMNSSNVLQPRVYSEWQLIA